MEFLIKSLQIVRNMQNSIETRRNSGTELGPPVIGFKFASSNRKYYPDQTQI